MSEVFVTSHGRQYHDPSRHRMTGSSKVYTSKKKARSEGYEPCGYCWGNSGRRPALRRDASQSYLRLYQEVDR